MLDGRLFEQLTRRCAASAVALRNDRDPAAVIAQDGGRCVDIFERPDGTFGFEEYRRDSEDGRGWFPIGHHASGVYATLDIALTDALRKVVWLREAVPGGG